MGTQYKRIVSHEAGSHSEPHLRMAEGKEETKSFKNGVALIFMRKIIRKAPGKIWNPCT